MSSDKQGSDILLDELRALVNIGGYCVRSVRRRFTLAWKTAAVAFVVLVLGMFATPKRYESGFRIQTDKTALIPALVNLQGAGPNVSDSITRGVSEVFRSRVYLNALIDETKLLERWSEGRPLPARMKDGLVRLLAGPMSEDELRTGLRKLLSERIRTSVDGGGGLIEVDVTWWSPEMTHVIAQGALKVFLDVRRENELNQIRDTLAILDSWVARSNARVNETADRLETLIREKESSVSRRVGAAATGPKTRVLSFRRTEAQPLSGEKAELAKALDTTEARASRLEQEYQAQLARAQERLDGLRKTLGPEHPDLKQAERDLVKFGQPPEELEGLRAEAARLRKQLDEGGQAAPTEEDEQNRFKVVQMPMTGDVYAALVADPEVDTMMNELSKYAQDHNELMDRRENAEVALETTRAAFNYRFVVTEPPMFPNGAAWPKPGIVFTVALFVALALGFGVAVFSDVWARRILEPWQLETFLGVKVLGRRGGA